MTHGLANTEDPKETGDEPAESSRAQPHIANAPSRKSGVRLILLVVLVFALQVAIILWLSDNPIPSTQTTRPSPSLEICAMPAEILALSDPTLFALPHMQSFSGHAWLKPPAVPERSFQWSEEPRWLNLTPAGLGVAVTSPQNANQFDLFEEVLSTEAQPAPMSVSTPSLFREKSELAVSGDLRRRRLLSSFDLPSRPYTDTLTNTVVGLLVNAEGVPVSVTLLKRSSDLEADRLALSLARTARFETEEIEGLHRSVPSQNKIIQGELVFQWHAGPRANTSAEGPPPPK